MFYTYKKRKKNPGNTMVFYEISRGNLVNIPWYVNMRITQYFFVSAAQTY